MEQVYVSYKGYPTLVPVRDSKRERVYEQEKIFTSQFGRPEWNLTEWRDVERFAKQVVGSKRWVKIANLFAIYSRNATAPVEVKRGRSNAAARGGRTRISIPPWAQNKVVVLHELAHTMDGRISTARRTCLGHQWPWALIFTSLCSTFLGADAARELKKLFKAARIRYTAPPRLTEAQRLARREVGRKLQAASRARAILSASDVPTLNQEAT